MDNNWILIDNPDHNFYAPPGKWLEVCGDSGYVSQRWFIINAIFERDAWYDATGTRLSENGWEPTHWRRMSSIPKADPCSPARRVYDQISADPQPQRRPKPTPRDQGIQYYTGYTVDEQAANQEEDRRLDAIDLRQWQREQEELDKCS